MVPNTEEDDMRLIVDTLRQRSLRNAGNCLKPQIGSEEDRLCARMVAKGYLKSGPGGGYMLP
jgi:hypothetical protein